MMKDTKPDKLYRTLAVPSVVSSYSIAMEYIKKWFFAKFPETYFKSVYIEQKHPLDEFRQFNIDKGLKKLKPSVAISPQLNFEFDRDTLDLYQADINDYLRRRKSHNYFFVDVKNNMTLSTIFEVLEITFTFKIRVATRAKQIDLYKYLLLAFRFGSTQGRELTMDFHIPYDLMMQVAIDAGFDVKDNKVCDIIGFVRYLNLHSIVPIIYKYRNINGKDEFFMRVGNLYTHISCLEKPSADDGERSGQLLSNYTIEFPVTLRIPSPQFYAYHSNCKQEEILKITQDPNNDNLQYATIGLPSIPDADEHDWNQYLFTEYYSDELKNVKIELKDLFENSDLYNVMKQTMDIMISPSVYMNMKLYSNGKELKYNIDWWSESFELSIQEKIESHVIQISIYADQDFIRSQVYNEERYKDRIVNSDRKDDKHGRLD